MAKLPPPEEMRLLVAEKAVIRKKLDDLFVTTDHPVTLVVIELIRKAAQMAHELDMPLDDCLDQFRGEYEPARPRRR